MLRLLARRLYRDRRRYAVMIVFLFLAGATTFWGVRTSLFSVPMPLVAGLAFVVGIGIFAPILSLLIPPWRFTIEIAAVGLFALALIGQFIPSLSLHEITTRVAIWAFVAMNLLSLLYTTQFLDRWFMRKDHTLTGRAKTRLPQQRVWDGVIGTPPHIDKLAKNDLVTFENVDGDPMQRRLVQRINGTSLLEEIQTLDQLDEPRRIGFQWHVPQSDDPEKHRGYARTEITDTGRKRVITRTMTPAQYPLRAALMNWIDDTYGRMLDDDLNDLERPKATAQTPPPLPA
ncbi:hypothetical protein [Octadecabacter sp. R77987]|uniref:hypothetical protein n=1 Tax=Octadecabacter sp. R77987 TaxID=3093874 RepID=UPI00366A936A